MTSAPSVSLSWVNTVVAAAERQGVSSAELLARAGVAHERLSAPRWPVDDITRLWRAAAELTGDAAFGLNTGRQVGPGSFNVVSFILLSSATLRSAIAQLQEYQRLISDGGRFQTLAGDQRSWLIYHPLQGSLAFSPHQVESVLAAAVCFSRWVTGKPVQPVRVQFSHGQIGPLPAYARALGAEVQFEQAFNGLLLENAVLDAPLPQADAELAQLHRAHAAAQLAALSAPALLRSQVEQWLSGALAGSVPGRAQAAQQFGLGERAFARRLQGEGVRYAELVDGVRHALACQAVAGGGESFARIARRLGFSEASAFNRAFRRWTGRTPGDWQQHRAASAQTAPPVGR
ncbi:AraC family transcriptional regulator [Simplicispira suum]|uniref:AraC family transcriptional regulator n=1 Tax=Simplicispira suum TaxID=2109915 RepID=A0A2S0N4E4_9BURK|nr:AraC family transcriptional regulator [Simplicispira suum]